MYRFSLLVLLLFLPASQAAAQRLSERDLGSRARILAPAALPPLVSGRLIGLTSDSLYVLSDPAATAPVVLARDQILRFELQGGPAVWRSTKEGALWGGLVGLVFGVTFGPLVAAGDPSTDPYLYAAGSTTSGIFWGGIVGALLGRFRWRTVCPHSSPVPCPGA